jgi:hypothetical protein
MKKWILLLCVLFLVGCKEEAPPTVDVEEPEVIVVDDEPFHNIKLYSSNNSIPYTIRYYDEMDDELYGTHVIEMYDSKGREVWANHFRDLEKKSRNFSSKPLIYEDKLIVNVQGVVSVHDLLTGQFIWEVETKQVDTDVAVKDGMLYVMYYEEDFITGILLENGKKVFHISNSITNMNRLLIDKTIMAYYETNDALEKNAIEYSITGGYIRKKHLNKQVEEMVSWGAAEASDDSEDISNLIDGSLETVWYEKVKSYGVGEWVELTKALPTLVNKLVIYNGNHESAKAFEENAKLKKITVDIGDGKSFEYEFEEFIYGQPTIIEFVKPVTADFIIVTIEEAEPGTLFKNTAITELYTQ